MNNQSQKSKINIRGAKTPHVESCSDKPKDEVNDLDLITDTDKERELLRIKIKEAIAKAKQEEGKRIASLFDNWECNEGWTLYSKEEEQRIKNIILNQQITGNEARSRR
jgi:hypothetical protein